LNIIFLKKKSPMKEQPEMMREQEKKQDIVEKPEAVVEKKKELEKPVIKDFLKSDVIINLRVNT